MKESREGEQKEEQLQMRMRSRKALVIQKVSKYKYERGNEAKIYRRNEERTLVVQTSVHT